MIRVFPALRLIGQPHLVKLLESHSWPHQQIHHRTLRTSPLDDWWLRSGTVWLLAASEIRRSGQGHAAGRPGTSLSWRTQIHFRGKIVIPQSWFLRQVEGERHSAGEVLSLLRRLSRRREAKILPRKLHHSGVLLCHNSNILQCQRCFELCSKTR